MKYYKITYEILSGLPRLMLTSESYMSLRHKIESPNLMEYKIRSKVAGKLFMPDLLTTPKLVISKRIYDVLEPLSLHNVQFLTARIYRNSTNFFDDYWGMHIYNIINCIDLNLSDVAPDEFGGIDGLTIKKLILDRASLEKIPLEERLVFEMAEHSSYKLFHESLVEKIMAINPTGLRFIDIEEYNTKTMFQNDSKE